MTRLVPSPTGRLLFSQRCGSMRKSVVLMTVGCRQYLHDAVDALATNIEARVVAVGTQTIPPRTSPPSASRGRAGR
jgi:hypothetical protein